MYEMQQTKTIGDENLKNGGISHHEISEDEQDSDGMYDQLAYEQTEGEQLIGNMDNDRDEQLFKIGSVVDNGISMETNEGDKENDKPTEYT